MSNFAAAIAAGAGFLSEKNAGLPFSQNIKGVLTFFNYKYLQTTWLFILVLNFAPMVLRLAPMVLRLASRVLRFPVMVLRRALMVLSLAPMILRYAPMVLRLALMVLRLFLVVFVVLLYSTAVHTVKIFFPEFTPNSDVPTPNSDVPTIDSDGSKTSSVVITTWYMVQHH